MCTELTRLALSDIADANSEESFAFIKRLDSSLWSRTGRSIHQSWVMSLNVSSQLSELMQDIGQYRMGGGRDGWGGRLKGRNKEGGRLLEVWLSGLLLSALLSSPSTCVTVCSWHSRLVGTILPLRAI